MAKPRKKKWEVPRKLVCGVASMALAAGLMPATAFAAVNVNEDGAVTYTLPTEPMAVQWTATDASGNSYTYENLTVSLSAPPMQKPYYSLLGISNTSLGRTIAGGGFTETEYGLFGSDANMNPDEYLYNYCVTLANPDAIVPADIRSGTESTIEASIDGTTYNMPRAIYTETNMLNVQADGTSGDYTYAQWVELENQRSGRSKTTEYNPTYISFSTSPGGTYRMVESIYSIAEAADEQIVASADENGNYTYATRYAEGANTVQTAQAFEDISKATQYYVLAKLADGSISQKAVTAVICGYDPNTENYAVRVLDPEGVSGDKDSNVYAGRIASAVHPIVTDMNTLGLETQQDAYTSDSVDETAYVKWYSAEQIIENCDACFTCDAPASNAVSRYLATASDGKKYDVYSADTSDGNTWGNNLGALLNAQAAAKAAGKNAADVCYKWPKSLFGVWYAQGCENVMMNFITAAYLYPQYFSLTDVMAWWAKHLWHITDASLQDMVDSTCYDISLSTNESQMGTISDDYEAKINAMIDEGNMYYLFNKDAVDAVADGNIATHNYGTLFARYADSIAATISDATSTAEATQAELDKVSAALAEAQTALADAQTAAAEQKAADDAALAEVQKALEQAQAAAASASTSSMKASTLTVKANTVTAKAKKKTTIKAAKAFKVSGAAGTVTYAKIKGNAKITVSAKGKVTVKKGLKKGKTYKVKVIVVDSGSATVAAGSKTVTLKVKVK